PPYEAQPRPGHELRNHLCDLGSPSRYAGRQRLRDGNRDGSRGPGSLDPAPRLHAAAPADGSVADNPRLSFGKQSHRRRVLMAAARRIEGRTIDDRATYEWSLS